jgi:hypothetical protein
MKIICEIAFMVNDEGRIFYRSNFDSGFFNSNKESANKVLEGLFYDFIFRMRDEKLIEYEIKENA